MRHECGKVEIRFFRDFGRQEAPPDLDEFCRDLEAAGIIDVLKKHGATLSYSTGHKLNEEARFSAPDAASVSKPTDPTLGCPGKSTQVLSP